MESKRIADSMVNGRRGEREKRRFAQIFPGSPFLPFSVSLLFVHTIHKDSAEIQGMSEKISSYKELRVYQNAIDTAMEIFEITKGFPAEEKYSLVDQIRRSSRSVCTNIAEAWRKRRYKAAFIAKLSDVEAEACETQVLIEISKRCNYINELTAVKLDKIYHHIISQIILMIDNADKWIIKIR